MRPIHLVIRDWAVAMIRHYPGVFPFGRAWTEWVTR